VNLYCPNSHSDRAKFFKEVLSWIPNCPNLIIGGDFNCDISEDNIWKEFISNSALIPSLSPFNIEPEFTFFRKEYKSKIDWIIIKGHQNILQWSVDYDSSPTFDGHLGLLCALTWNLGHGPPSIPLSPRNFFYLDRNDPLRTQFTQAVEDEIDLVDPTWWNFSNIPILNWYEIFNKIKYWCVDLALPYFSKTKWKLERDSTTGDWIRMLIWAKKLIRAHLILYSSNPSQSRSLALQSIINRGCRHLNLSVDSFPDPDSFLSHIKSLRNHYQKNFNHSYKKYCEERKLEYRMKIISAAHQNSPLFRKLYYPHSSNKPITLLQDGENWAHSKQDINRVCSKYFSELGDSPITPDFSIPIAQELLKFQNSPSYKLLENFTWSEFLDIIKDSKTSSAPSSDQIRYSILKILPYRALIVIFSLLKSIINDGRLPDFLSNGEVFLLHKGDSPFLLSNYRGITLLSILYKIITSFMQRRLFKFVSNRIDPCHSGAIPGRNSHDRVALFLQTFQYCKRSNTKLYVLSIDIVKAYDRLVYQGLIDGLIYHGVDKHFIALYQSILDSSTVIIRNGHGITDTIPIFRGCKQGCGLSPLLFILFMDMITRLIKEKIVGISISPIPNNHSPPRLIDKLSKPVQSLTFMDDLTILCPSDKQISKCLKLCYQFFKYYGLEINQKKSFTLLWSPTKDPNYKCHIDIISPSLLQ